MAARRAVFLDRDGVINELRYVGDEGRIETPMHPSQLRLVPGVAEGLNALRQAGYALILVSNQPGMAKGQFDSRMFERIRRRAAGLLKQRGARLDGEYYCFHHPAALRAAYRKRCRCRKPQPGLILQAAREHHVDVARSFMVGDGLVDVEAGRRAGCRTILVAHVSSLLTRLMRSKQLRPAYVAENFQEAVAHILAADGRCRGTVQT